MIRCVVFDVGETLVDETRAWSLLARAAGITPLTLAGMLGVVIDRDLHHRDVWGMLDVPRPAMEVDVQRGDLYPDVVDCLTALRRGGLRVGLAGNQPEGAERALAALGLPVDFIAGSASWGVPKPDPEFFAQVVETAGVPADEIAYVGDRLDNDVLPARAAGMTAIFIRRGPWGVVHALRPEVAQAGFRIESLEELPALMGVDASA